MVWSHLGLSSFSQISQKALRGEVPVKGSGYICWQQSLCCLCVASPWLPYAVAGICASYSLPLFPLPLWQPWVCSHGNKTVSDFCCLSTCLVFDSTCRWILTNCATFVLWLTYFSRSFPLPSSSVPALPRGFEAPYTPSFPLPTPGCWGDGLSPFQSGPRRSLSVLSGGLCVDKTLWWIYLLPPC